jgi:hypothetical protein
MDRAAANLNAMGSLYVSFHRNGCKLKKTAQLNLSLYTLPSITWMTKSGETYSTNSSKKKHFCGKNERPFARLRHRREDNITVTLGEIKWGGLNLIHLTRDRDQSQTINLRTLVHGV